MKKAKRQKTAVLIFLLLLAPVMGELLSGSAPPREFFQPHIFIILTILYGGGALLIREAKVRWRLNWSVIFLAVAYGIAEEGLMAQSFFNHNHADLGEIAFYGRWLGTNWPWAVQVTLFHATVSTMIPIMAADLLIPEIKDLPLLNRRGIIIFASLLFADIVLFALFIILQAKSMTDPYIPNPIILAVWTAVTFLLVFLAYKCRKRVWSMDKGKIKRPAVFFIFAMLFQLINLFLPHIAKGLGLPDFLSVLLQLALAVCLLIFVYRQVFNRYITLRHKMALISGTVGAFIAMAPVYLFVKQDISMAVTELAALVLLLLYRRIVIKKHKTPNTGHEI